MEPRARAAVLSLLALLLPAAAAPSTIAPPANLGELARLSRSVVFARALDSAPDGTRSALPFTATRFERLRHVAGEALPEVFVVSEPGGIAATMGFAVGGSPVYKTGRSYLLFLDRRKDGRLGARMMAYGLLVEDETSGLLQPLAEAADLDTIARVPYEPPTAYVKSRLLDHLAEVGRGREWNAALAGSVAAAGAEQAAPGGCEFLTSSTDGLPIRWFGYELGINASAIRHTTPGQIGIADGGVSAVAQGAAAWTSHRDSLILLSYAGSTPRALDCASGAEQNAVWFNDPCSDIPDLVSCSGTLAFGGAYFTANTGDHNGVLWHPAAATFVVVNNGVQCVGEVNFHEVLAHELGHSQGFGHHAVQPAPNNPTMSATLKADGRGASLVGLDKTCASWAYHTFVDVPYEHIAWRFVEAVENAGVTGGCSPALYCPDSPVTREQMAVFLLLAREGAGYSPAPCTVPPFADVPVTSPSCRWIRELAARNVTSGCGNGSYCPGTAVTREQMAVFLLRTKEGAAYVPPACVIPTFADVPCSSPYAPWIYELARRGIVGGCLPGLYCPTRANTRAEMAILLTTTFGLTLPS
jgi:hypothetical protein